MHHTLELPLRGEATDPDAVAQLARSAERAGFAHLGYTDHPAPSAKWLGAGGHPTFDPFSGLSYVAAVTDRIGLMTYLAVLPYRNPLLLARSVATVDRLSGGRLTLVAGTGYLRSEFSALGRSFDQRNDDFDECIDVLARVFVDDEFTFAGRDFTASGVTFHPKPVQLPHPPIWIGGSSRASRERAARIGDGWAPILLPEGVAKTVRSAPLTSDDALAAAIDEVRHRAHGHGRDPDRIAVQLDGAITMGGDGPATVDRIAELCEIGVTHLVTRPPDGAVEEQTDAIERFGSEVISAG